MKLNVNVQQSKVFISWSKAENADYYRVICKINDNYTEYAKVYDTCFMKMSLLPYCENSCYVQAVKNGVVIEETAAKNFNINAVDIVAYKDSEGKLTIHYSRFPNAEGYRLYSDSGDYKFNGLQNSYGGVTTTEYKKGVSYKIKPYTTAENEKRVILQSSDVFECMEENPFTEISIHKTYGNGMFLSWLYEEEADGFEVWQNGSEFPVFSTSDGLRHYAVLRNFNLDTKFYVTAYINSPNGKITVSHSNYAVCSGIDFGTPEISLIVPAYNAENYIARSLDTALASTFKNFEIIVVNDGCTDSTQDIIDWYAANYNNVVSMKRPNGGVAAARNTGIQAARGEYIAFMDNDDMIRPDMLEKLYRSITKNKCDIAIAPLYRVLDNGYSTHCNLPFDTDTAVDTDKYLDIMYTTNYYNCAIWNKLYKASLVKAHPLGILKYEDVSWTPCIVSWAKNFCFLDTPLYEWDRKLRPATFGDVLAKMPQDELFENRKQAMMFFIENGNPEKKEYLKEIAKRRLRRYDGNSRHSGYKELINRL